MILDILAYVIILAFILFASWFIFRDEDSHQAAFATFITILVITSFVWAIARLIGLEIIKWLGSGRLRVDINFDGTVDDALLTRLEDSFDDRLKFVLPMVEQYIRDNPKAIKVYPIWIDDSDETVST